MPPGPGGVGTGNTMIVFITVEKFEAEGLSDFPRLPICALEFTSQAWLAPGPPSPSSFPEVGPEAQLAGREGLF